VQSIAIVPVGLTRYHRRDLRPYGPDEAEPILDQITAWQREYQRRHGLNLVYASDEWYLLAGHEVLSADEYDGFPQLENGVGLTRVFLDEWEETRFRVWGSTLNLVSAQSSRPAASGVDCGPRRAKSSYGIKVRKITLVCGTLITPLLEEIAAEFGQLTGLTVEVTSVVNEFFGPTVTVSGLLTGQDVIEALQGRDLGDVVFLPRTMFDAAAEVTLDDMTPLQIAARLGTTRVEIAGAIGELAGLLDSIS